MYTSSLASISVLIAKIFCIVLPLLLSVAFLTFVERKLMASMQRRKGPNVLGFILNLYEILRLLLRRVVVPPVPPVPPEPPEPEAPRANRWDLLVRVAQLHRLRLRLLQGRGL